MKLIITAFSITALSYIGEKYSWSRRHLSEALLSIVYLSLVITTSPSHEAINLNSDSIGERGPFEMHGEDTLSVLKHRPFKARRLKMARVERWRRKFLDRAVTKKYADKRDEVGRERERERGERCGSRRVKHSVSRGRTRMT